MTLIAVPEILREKLGRDGAEALVGILNDNILAVAEEKFENRITITENKFDNRIAATETKFDSRIAITENKFDNRMAALEERFERRLAETKAEIIKWMFIFWIGQFASITAVLFLFFKR
ncbi:MAG: hypothetical protein COS41_02490 [Elusimicrobia bacterium CG03_land_8_20_14_0_80_50_18]|nr:MAG: hypothetical protein COS41_02490 [Elusimicrobia bacterium CG03_land_8_20_14_0_80_50_18]